MRGGFVPGDVASFEVGGGERATAIRTSEGKWTAYAPGVDRSWLDREWDGRHGQRRLVVIDPEDRAQTDALAEALVAAVCTQGHEWDKTNAYEIRAHMGTALRSLVSPTKPPEPQGLGAVVEDDAGERWVRSRRPGHRGLLGVEWGNERTLQHVRYAEIAAVKVLSEGVTPDE